MSHQHDFDTSSSSLKMMAGLQPKNLFSLAAASFLAFVAYTLIKTIHFGFVYRRRYHDIPALPRHWLLGNLEEAGKRLDPANVEHPDYGIEQWWEELGRPGAFLMDIAPIDTPIVVVADPAIAEQIVQPSNFNKYSTLKSDTTRSLWRLMGTESMLTAEGETWRSLRKRFNKGFSPAHLHSLAPLVVSKTRIFTDRLLAVAETGEVFAMKDYAQDLTTDIITTIAIEKDFGSQSCPEGQGPKGPYGFLTASRKLSGLTYKVGQGFNLRAYLDPIRPTKAWFYARIQNQILEQLIREKLKADAALPQQADNEKPSTSGTGVSSSAKAIVQLALQGLTPTDQLIRNTRDQIKTFLFAGQDTTATAIQWITYELYQSQYNPTLSTFVTQLQSEHDTVFGTSTPFNALSVLSDPSQAETILGDKLPLTTAFVKEILRVHPPAATARMAPANPTHEPPLTLLLSGKPVLVDGLRLYPSHWIMQRSEKVWGDDAKQFRPARWLDDTYVRNLPVGAWRPFERGPRNCIGQELAMMELKVVVCAVARGLVFEKIGFSGRNGEREVFNVHEVTAVPNDGMVMRVRKRE